MPLSCSFMFMWYRQVTLISRDGFCQYTNIVLCFALDLLPCLVSCVYFFACSAAVCFPSCATNVCPLIPGVRPSVFQSLAMDNFKHYTPLPLFPPPPPSILCTLIPAAPFLNISFTSLALNPFFEICFSSTFVCAVLCPVLCVCD